MNKIMKFYLCFLMVFGLLAMPSNVSAEEVIELNRSEITLLLDDNATLLDESDLTATLNIDEDVTVTWNLSEEGIVELTEETGRFIEITALAEGNVTITASISDSNGTTYSDSCEVNVVTVDSSLSAESFSITESTTLNAGGCYNADLIATVTPINTDYDIEWTSSDESIATVTKCKKNTAEVESGHAGTAVITATLTDVQGNVYTDTCTVTVIQNSISDAAVTLDASSYTYTGGTIKPDVTVVYGSTTLTKDTNYTLSYINNTNVGTATITITGIGDYTDTYTKTFEITTKSIANFTATLSTSSYTYDGTAKKPTVTVKDANGNILVNGTDYMVTYSDNTKIGTATVKITGKGNYTGTITKTFTINSINITNFTATLSKTSYTYDGSAKKPTVTVKDANGKTLTKGTDYSVSYKNNTNAGTATVTITGIGNYSSTLTKTFTINTKSISKFTATLSKTSYTYTGSSIKTTVTVKDASGNKLVSGTDFSVSYKNNTSVGTATVTIKGIGNYSGSLTKTFKITKRSLSNCTVSLSTTSYTYNGSTRKPTVTVKNGSTTISSSNYTVTYASGRKNVGTYKVTIKGKGNCSGTVTKTFTIKAKSISSFSASLSTSTYTYDGKTKKPSVTVKNGSSKLSSSNYTVTYASGRKNVGSYKVTIKGKGNYTGTITKTFKINPVKTSIKSLTKGEYAFTVKWTKKTTQVTGYQIQYSTSSSFSNATTKTITKNSTTSKKISSLKGNKKYYVRIRTYKTVSGTKYYSGWSSSKSVTTNPSFDVSSLQVADETDKIIVVTASSTSTSSGTFRYFKKTNGTWKEVIYTTAYLGQNGINKTKEGDRKTPTGLYHFSKLMGIASNPGTQMSYTKINKYMYWCGSKKYYNQFIDESKQEHNCNHSNDEHLIDYTTCYQYIAALDYNSSCTYGKGSAIFLHCTGNSKYTGGCVAISKSNMKQMMTEIDKDTVIIIDLTSNISSKKY
ncbi:MAG: L,D-transpeptidase family protein [Erysipelotrichaceae bacterium]|nr:L,D-transpeptidase family protein [Erysipelotrichaceae bacterium]